MSPCPCCGAKTTTTVWNGRDVTYCRACLWPVTVKSLNDFLASGGETDEDKAAISRYEQAMADLEQAMRTF